MDTSIGCRYSLIFFDRSYPYPRSEGYVAAKHGERIGMNVCKWQGLNNNDANAFHFLYWCLRVRQCRDRNKGITTLLL